MVKVKHPDEIAFAGDYNLPRIDLYNHKGQAVDLKNIVHELNIYESIYKNAITGSIVVVDANNFIGKMEIQGLERLSFKLETPGSGVFIDASMETGDPFHVYKISDRRQVNDNLMLFTLHFGSREFMRNIRTKVSQAYDKRLDMSVMSIFTDPEYLDSRKNLYHEPTGNSFKMVIPNLRPFDAINLIAKRAMPEKSKGVGYYFYETTKGFHFKSWDNMCSVDGKIMRKPKQKFYYMQIQSKDSDLDMNKIEHEFKSVESYKFVNNFHDVAANTALGTYGHRVITYNLFEKTRYESDYNYHTQFDSSIHVDNEGSYTDAGKYAVVDAKVDFDNEKNVSDYAESRVSLQTSTKFLHDDDVGMYGIDSFTDSSTTGQKVSQNNQVLHGTLLKLVVKGQTYINAGDVIEFDIHDGEHTKGERLLDPRFAGKYVVVNVRHQVGNNEYKMVLECAKDSSYLPMEPGSTQWSTEKQGGLFSTYGDDQGSS